ncbi:putative metallophosphoesterase [Planctopirus ephydatiae]|uniref:Putative metallophosphoesterase n=1 Tax=Planctopirus ephydatiae TaxID=2528019 RepID=A0A518GT18_9PLAN|nr:metallophosphoesterase [Planctopirus ephydatiae]QDV31723.1 putative metallophosphoesterase [Planctopirus ephydatiae]
MQILLLAGWIIATFGWLRPIVAAINYLSAKPYSRQTLQWIHGVLFVCAGVVGIVGTAVFSIRLLSIEPLAPSILETGYLICGVGLVGWWVADVIEWQRACRRSVDEECHLQRLSWKNALQHHPGASRLLGLPGNEVLMLEVAQRIIRCEGLPEVASGLSIAHLSDVHFREGMPLEYFRAVFEELGRLRPDLYIFTGDLHDDPDCLRWVPELFGSLHAPLGCYFVLGNHDWHADHVNARIALEDAGWIDLAGRVLPLRDPSGEIVIAGTEFPWMGDLPPFASMPDNRFRILASHTPDLWRWAVDQHVHLMLAGHTHGGQCRLPILGPVFAPSVDGVRYAGGLYKKNSMYLHVSRGISGKDRLRFGCLPEITRFVLKCSPRTELTRPKAAEASHENGS